LAASAAKAPTANREAIRAARSLFIVIYLSKVESTTRLSGGIRLTWLVVGRLTDAVT
jgi:hypothetical protein